MDYLKLGAASFEELRGAAARASRLAERRRATIVQFAHAKSRTRRSVANHVVSGDGTPPPRRAVQHRPLKLGSLLL